MVPGSGVIACEFSVRADELGEPRVHGIAAGDEELGGEGDRGIREATSVEVWAPGREIALGSFGNLGQVREVIEHGATVDLTRLR